MTLVMNQLLDSKLTKDRKGKEKNNKTIEKQEEDAMFLWDGVSLFDTEESALKSECTPTAKKDMDSTISKIKRLQMNVKRQINANVEDKTPEVTTINQETEPINEPVIPVEG